MKNISPDHHQGSGGKRGKKSTICKAGCCTDGGTDASNEHCSKKRFTLYQVETLKREFAESPYISQSQAALIARRIGLKKLQVRKWFSDYRCKIKKQSITLEDESSLPLSFLHSENQIYVDDESEAERIEVVDDQYSTAADYNKYPSSGGGGGTGMRKKLMKKRSKKANTTDDDYDYGEQTNKKRFSPYQVEMLKKAFENSPYITQSEAAVIARNTGLKKMQVRKWFCDYRCKIKKQSLRLQRLQMLDDEKSKDGKFTKRQLSIRRLMRFHEQSRNENDNDIDVGEQFDTKKIVRSGRKKSSAQNLGFNFTQEQLRILNEEFEKSQFITEERLAILAEKIQEKKSTIKNWFTKKRYKTAESEQKFWTDLIEGSCDT